MTIEIVTEMIAQVPNYEMEVCDYRKSYLWASRQWVGCKQTKIGVIVVQGQEAREK